MAAMAFDLVVFGDSVSDGGHLGYGVAGKMAGGVRSS